MTKRLKDRRDGPGPVAENAGVRHGGDEADPVALPRRARADSLEEAAR